MPTYEYQCDKCGGEFDFFQSIKEAPKDTCEKCGGHLTKLLSAGTGLIFKGSGFYITDYKSGGGKAEGGASDSASKSEGTSKSDGKAAVTGSAGSGDSKASGGGDSKPSTSDSKSVAPASAKSKD